MGNICDIKSTEEFTNKDNMFRPTTSDSVLNSYNLAKLHYQILELSPVSMDEIKILNVEVG
jgi:hypothetical protein